MIGLIDFEKDGLKYLPFDKVHNYSHHKWDHYYDIEFLGQRFCFSFNSNDLHRHFFKAVPLMTKQWLELGFSYHSTYNKKPLSIEKKPLLDCSYWHVDQFWNFVAIPDNKNTHIDTLNRSRGGWSNAETYVCKMDPLTEYEQFCLQKGFLTYDKITTILGTYRESVRQISGRCEDGFLRVEYSDVQTPEFSEICRICYEDKFVWIKPPVRKTYPKTRVPKFNYVFHCKLWKMSKPTNPWNLPEIMYDGGERDYYLC